MKNIYHLCTEALKDALLCYDEDDYKVVWNILAVCGIVTGIKIYCFCIMSNHIHILLSGDKKDIIRFFRMFKMKMGRHVVRKHHKTIIRGLKYKLFAVTDRKTFCQEVAYILRNPFKAGLRSPYSYRWSSIRIYFSTLQETGTDVNDISDKKRFSMLKTRFNLPCGVRVSSDGLIILDSFVDKLPVERAFDNSSILFFFLKQWNLEDIVRGAHGEIVQDAYSDNEVFDAIKKECRDIYNVSDPGKLDSRSLVRIVRKLRARFGTSSDQLKRLLPVDNTFLDKLL